MAQSVKNPPALREWRRQWQPTQVLLPGKSHGWRSLVGCSPRGREESDTTERLHFHFPLSCIGEGNGNPLQCSCLENPRDGGAWLAVVYGVTQSRTRLKWFSSYSSSSNSGDLGSVPGLRKSPGNTGQPTSVFLPGESPWTEEPGVAKSQTRLSNQAQHNTVFKNQSKLKSVTKKGVCYFRCERPVAYVQTLWKLKEICYHKQKILQQRNTNAWNIMIWLIKCSK